MSSSDLTKQAAPRPRDLVTLAIEINDLHDRATEAATTAIEHARACGELLNQAKAKIGHGSFLPWLEANCRVKPRQAQKFMKLAREWSAIEGKCASNAHLPIDGVLRLLGSGEKQAAEAENRTMSDPDDPFGEDDPFEDEGTGEDGRTDSDGQYAQERPPGSQRNGTEAPAGRTPAEEFKIQKSKTIKTLGAAMREFGDLNRLRKSQDYGPAKDGCRSLLQLAKNW